MQERLEARRLLRVIVGRGHSCETDLMVIRYKGQDDGRWGI